MYLWAPERAHSDLINLYSTVILTFKRMLCGVHEIDENTHYLNASSYYFKDIFNCLDSTSKFH
jgi:hypothetical protein